MGRQRATSGLDLFGGDQTWNANDWTASDDRVRGGISHSYFATNGRTGRVYGNLDIKTLGGAGFASQRTVFTDKVWDLSAYQGIRLDVQKSDGKTYALNLKDALRPQVNGTDVSAPTWEYVFNSTDSATCAAGQAQHTYFVPWSDFVLTYRGRNVTDPPALQTEHVKQFAIMMRSFFGDQSGPFDISIGKISAYTADDKLGFDAASTHRWNRRGINDSGLTAGGLDRTLPVICAAILTFAILRTLYTRWR